MKATNHSAHVLLLGADQGEANLIQQTLSEATPGFKCKVDVVSTTSSAVQRLRQSRFDDVIVNMSQGEGEDLRAVQRIHNSSPDVPIFILTESTDANMRHAALKHGASDCLIKKSDVYENLRTRIRHLAQEREILKNLVSDYCYRKTLISGAPCPIVGISSEGRVIEFNHQAERLWHCPGREVVGRDFLSLFAADRDRDALARAFTQTLSGHLSKNCKATVASKDDGHYSLLWDMSSIGRMNSETAAVMAIGHAITESETKTHKCSADQYVEYRSNFEDTAYMVLAGLSAIIQRLDCLSNVDPSVLRRLSDELPESKDEAETLPPEKASAVERLILSLLTDKLPVT